MNPQRAHVSGPSLEDVQGLIMTEPHVGEPMQLFLEGGKLIRTSPVKQVSRTGTELVVDTVNSRYRVTLMSPAS